MVVPPTKWLVKSIVSLDHIFPLRPHTTYFENFYYYFFWVFLGCFRGLLWPNFLKTTQSCSPGPNLSIDAPHDTFPIFYFLGFLGCFRGFSGVCLGQKILKTTQSCSPGPYLYIETPHDAFLFLFIFWVFFRVFCHMPNEYLSTRITPSPAQSMVSQI